MCNEMETGFTELQTQVNEYLTKLRQNLNYNTEDNKLVTFTKKHLDLKDHCVTKCVVDCGKTIKSPAKYK